MPPESPTGPGFSFLPWGTPPLTWTSKLATVKVSDSCLPDSAPTGGEEDDGERDPWEPISPETVERRSSRGRDPGSRVLVSLSRGPSGVGPGWVRDTEGLKRTTETVGGPSRDTPGGTGSEWTERPKRYLLLRLPQDPGIQGSLLFRLKTLCFRPSGERRGGRTLTPGVLVYAILR